MSKNEEYISYGKKQAMEYMKHCPTVKEAAEKARLEGYITIREKMKIGGR